MNAHTFPMPVIPAVERPQETAAEPIIFIDLDFPDAFLDAYPGADVVTLGLINVERKIRAVSPYEDEAKGWW